MALPNAHLAAQSPIGFIRPCEPTLVDRPPAGSGGLHEVKHDGFRILARKQGERVTLWSRRGANFTDRFSRIAEAVRSLNANDALIDGEAEHDGRSDFGALATKRGGMQASLVAFDLLRLAVPSAPASSMMDGRIVRTSYSARRLLKKVNTLLQPSIACSGR